MALMKVLGLLAIAASTIASPAGIEPADETVTVTVTTTAVSLVTVVPPPPAPTSVPPVTTTILRTRTATTWTRTTTVVSPLNCTRTVLLAPPRITTSRAPPPRITLSLLGRQANSSSSVVPTGRSTFPPPPPFPPARTSTRTVFTTTTATQTGDLRRTRFECGTTVTLLYTVDHLNNPMFAPWPTGTSNRRRHYHAVALANISDRTDSTASPSPHHDVEGPITGETPNRHHQQHLGSPPNSCRDIPAR
ncbi:hypothetical protein OQA88_1702 [Cercophora sp. LCS_1]